MHLEEHRKELSGIKVYTCKTCDKEFKTSAHLKEHMKSHAKMRSSILVFYFIWSSQEDVKMKSKSYLKQPCGYNLKPFIG